MSTTCQAIIDRAKSFNALNAPLASDSTEMMTRIRAIQQRLFTAVADIGRARFTTSQAVNSTSAASGRTYALTGLTLPLERILKVTLTATGAEVNKVSEIDPDAKRAPRYFIRGTSIVEVGSDWSAATEAVSLTILHVFGATSISPTASPSSVNVSVPDEWIDTVILPLAMYFHQKDPGRDPGEYERLTREYTDTWSGFLAYLTNYSGDTGRLPPPPELPRSA